MFGFHVVHCRVYNYHTKKLDHLGYEIYLNNKKFISLSYGLELTRREAELLRDQLNGF